MHAMHKNTQWLPRSRERPQDSGEGCGEGNVCLFVDAHAHGGGAAASQDATARPETSSATAEDGTRTGGRSESTAAQLEHALAVALSARHAPSPPAQLARHNLPARHYLGSDAAAGTAGRCAAVLVPGPQRGGRPADRCGPSERRRRPLAKGRARACRQLQHAAAHGAAGSCIARKPTRARAPPTLDAAPAPRPSRSPVTANQRTAHARDGESEVPCTAPDRDWRAGQEDERCDRGRIIGNPDGKIGRKTAANGRWRLVQDL
jgi:hypothetical protein